MPNIRPILIAGAWAVLTQALPLLQAHGQGVAPATQRWEVNALPALNFDSDEGFGYGVIAQVYKYGGQGVAPYALTIQPTVFLTTEGRRDVSLFVDAPRAFGGNWRFDAYVGREQRLATPYYGTGNDTNYEAAREAEPNKYFYRYGRRAFKITSNLQHPTGIGSLSALLGVGTQSVKINATPFDEGTTLLAQEARLAPIADGKLNFIRTGLVYDTRDREVGTTRGTWADVLVQRVDKNLGSTVDFTRLTLTGRHYQSIGRRLVFADRALFQTVSGDVPFYDITTIQGSFKEAEGLGGSGSVRGLPKNRFAGKTLLLNNAELRWKAVEFSLRGKSANLVLSTFVDAGRVWQEADDGNALSNLHAGFGGGTRLGYGNNFVVAIDVAHSKLATAPIYIGLGYLF